VTRRFAAVAVLALALIGCGEGDVNAPDWVLMKARDEASRLDEEDPDITSASCGSDACSVDMSGSFTDVDSRAPRLVVRISLDSRAIVERIFYYGD
jgi:hypothetical protein